MALFYRGRQRILDANANPVPGAKANFYLTGTTTRTDTYQDSDLTTPHANPVVADSDGFLDPIYLDPAVSYRVIITDSADVSLPDGTVDPVETDALVPNFPQTQAEINAGVTPTDLQYAQGHILRYGANTTPGTTDMSTALQNAINVVDGVGGEVFIPSGTYLLSSGITINTGGFTMRGENTDQTLLVTDIVGDDLFTLSSVSRMSITDMQIQGNDLTGVTGTGHCFNMIDDAIGSGSFTPQSVIIERVRVRFFRGESTDGDGGTIKSCAAIMYNALNCVFRDCILQNCGIGVYITECFNLRFDNVIWDRTDEESIIINDADENMIFTNCDILEGNFAGTAGSKVLPKTGFTPLGHGVVIYRGENTVFRDTKAKNYDGESVFGIYRSAGTVFDGCWLRPDKITDGDQKLFYVFDSSGTKVINSDISFVNNAIVGNTQVAEVHATQVVDPRSHNFSFENNTLNYAPTKTVDYIVKFTGNTATNRVHMNATIRGNTFGDEQGPSSASFTLNDVVIVENCFVYGLNVSDNTIFIDPLTTVTDFIDVSTGATLVEPYIERNIAIGGGTLTNFSNPGSVVTAAGAIPTFLSALTIDTTSGAIAISLADGFEGQQLDIVMTVDGGDATLTPASFHDGTTITFNDVGDTAHLAFVGGSWSFAGGTATVA